jgi:hypothetical protein
MAKDAGRIRRRERKNITSGIAHVNSTFNNTMITITDVQGNTIAWSSSGAMGFKGSRKLQLALRHCADFISRIENASSLRRDFLIAHSTDSIDKLFFPALRKDNMSMTIAPTWQNKPPGRINHSICMLRCFIKWTAFDNDPVFCQQVSIFNRSHRR